MMAAPITRNPTPLPPTAGYGFECDGWIGAAVVATSSVQSASTLEQ